MKKLIEVDFIHFYFFRNYKIVIDKQNEKEQKFVKTIEKVSNIWYKNGKIKIG